MNFKQKKKIKIHLQPSSRWQKGFSLSLARACVHKRGRAHSLVRLATRMRVTLAQLASEVTLH